MADELELKLDSDNANKATGKVSKKIIIIAVVVILALVATAVALFFVLGADKGSSENKETISEAAVKVEGPIQYFTLGQSFVINFVTQTRQHYVRITIDVVTRNPSVIATLQLHEPMVRNDILRIVGEKGFNSLRNIDSKLALQQEIKEHLAKILKEEANVEGIEAVIFTEFVMQ